MSNIVKFIRGPEKEPEAEELGDDEVYCFMFNEKHTFEIAFLDDGIIITKSCPSDPNDTTMEMTILNKTTLLLN